MHLAVWLVLDRQLAWPQIVEDLTKRPYIIVGMAAALLLTPLALTSNNAALRRLGPLVWRRIHRLAYPATALAAIHFVWLVKAWPPEPLLYAAGGGGAAGLSGCCRGALRAPGRPARAGGPDGARRKSVTSAHFPLARLCGDS